MAIQNFETKIGYFLFSMVTTKMLFLARDHPFSTYASFPEKLTFLNP